jgi:hypothetical protein
MKTARMHYSETVHTSRGPMAAWLLIEGSHYQVLLVELDNNDNVVEEYDFDNSIDAYDAWKELIASLRRSS